MRPLRTRSGRRAWAPLILAVAIVAVPLPGAAAQASSHDVESSPRALAQVDAECEAGWSDVTSSWTRVSVASVAAAGDRLWVVGMRSDPTSEDGRSEFAAHWDGAAWTEDGFPTSSSERALFGVDRSSDGRVWAVGYRRTSAGYRPSILRRKQGSWTRAGIDGLGSTTGALTAIRALRPDATWAVGYQLTSLGQRPFATTLVDGRWVVRSPTMPRGATGALLGVDVRSARDVWAVGWASTTGRAQPFITHWDGRRWRTQQAASSGNEAGLLDVAADERGVWAVGYRVAGARHRPMVQRWDGERWHREDITEVTGPLGILRSVTIDADGEPIVVGARWDADSERWRGFTAHRGQADWSVLGSPGSLGTTDLRAIVARDDGRVTVAGSRGTRSLMANVCPTPNDDPPEDAGIRTHGAALTLTGMTVAPTRETDTDHPGDEGPAESTGPDPGSTDPTPDPPVASDTPDPTPGGSAAPGPTSIPRPDPSRRPGPAAAPTATPGPGVVARDRTAAARLTQTTTTYGAIRADFDGDGWPDLFIGRHSDPARLMLNDHGKFQTSTATFRDRDRHGCTAGDLDGDGRIDLYCAIGSSHGAVLKVNELLLQQEDGTFIDRAAELGAADPLGRGRLAVTFDLDHDGRLDLFVATRADRPDGLPSHHQVLANQGDGGLRSRSVAGFDAGSGADCLRAADLDRDGWQDIVLCAKVDRPGGYGLRLLRNVRGRLVDVTAKSRIPRARAVDVAIGDMDGDRRPDIVQITTTSLKVYLRRGDHYILGYSRGLANGAAVAIGDADGDGDLDIYVAQGSRKQQRQDLLLLNRGDGRAFSRLALPDTRPGSAESVIAIDHDRNGLMDFLVLNGRGVRSPGPIQLIALFRKD